MHEATSTSGSFVTDVVAPLKKLLLNLSPIQSGSGTPSPDNVRPISGHTECVTSVCGVNVWDEEWAVGGINSSNGQDLATISQIRSKGFISILPSTAYFNYFGNIEGGGNFQARFYDSDKEYIGYVDADGVAINKNRVFVTPSNARYMRFQVQSTYGTTYNHDISINYPSTDHDYHAYDGNTYTTDLGRTVYGGTLDVVSGVLTINRGIAVFDGTENYDNRYFPTIVCNEGFEQGSGGGNDFVCNYCPSSITYFNYASGTKRTFQFSNAPTNWGANSADEIKTKIAEWYANGEPLTIAYPLATPQTYQLDPQTISLLHGNNNVWSDGSVVMVYNADVQLWVLKQLGTSGTRTLSMTRTLAKSEDTDDTKSVQLAED